MAELNPKLVEPRRLFGFFSALAFSVSGISLAYSGLLPLTSIIGMWPSERLAGILTVGMLLCILLTYSYATIGSAAPYAGADYVLASRVLGGGVAFVASWTFVVFSGLLCGFIIVTIIREFIPFSLQTLAILGNIPGIANTAESLQTPTAQATLGTALSLGLFLMSMVPPRVSSWILRIGLILGVLAWGVMLYQLATPSVPFSTAWDRFMGANHYAEQLNLARSLRMPMTLNIAPVSSAGVLAALWVFFGGMVPVFFAHQVKKPGRTLLLSGLAGLLLCWLLICGVVLTLQVQVPARWLAAESFLYLNPGYTGLALPFLPLYAGVVHPDIILSILVIVVMLFGMLNLIQVIYYAVSRIIFAWAKDKIFPAIFRYEHPLLKTPVVCVFMVGLLAQLGVMDSSLGGRLGDRGVYVFVIAACLLVPVVALIIFPITQKARFKKAGWFNRFGIGPIPFASLVGLLTVIFLGVAFLTAWVSPLMEGIRFQALFSLLVVSGTGLVWFSLRKRFLKQQGENLDDILKTFPEQ